MKSKNPVARFNYEKEILLKNKNVTCKEIEHGIIVENLISEEENKTIYSIYEKQNKIPVGLDGIVSNFKPGDLICSYRATLFSKKLAEDIFIRIKNHLPEQKGYEAIGINESFRFIDYKESGVLIPHYDNEYRRDNGEISLLTLVIYLKTANNGRTQFIKEIRKNHNFEDWNRMANQNEILETAENKTGSALIFPHYTLHQGEKVDGRKIIIRSDIMFKKI